MEGAKLVKTPMQASNPLSRDELGKPLDQMIYKGMIDSLLYLTASRHDIMYSVCSCARFQFDPWESHLKLLKGSYTI